MTTTPQKKCRVNYKGVQRNAEIVEERLGKVKLKVLDDKGDTIYFSWFETNEIKRL